MCAAAQNGPAQIGHAQIGRAQIGLVDFDGWDHVGFGYSLAEVLRLPKPKMGHAFVLAGLLTNDRFWLARDDAPALIRDDDPLWDILGW